MHRELNEFRDGIKLNGRPGKNKWGVGGALIDAPLIPAGFQSFLRNLVESGGIKFGRDTSQNDIPGDEYSCGMRSFLISCRNGPRNGQKGMQLECKNQNTYYYY